MLKGQRHGCAKQQQGLTGLASKGQQAWLWDRKHRWQMHGGPHLPAELQHSCGCRAAATLGSDPALTTCTCRGLRHAEGQDGPCHEAGLTTRAGQSAIMQYTWYGNLHLFSSPFSFCTRYMMSRRRLQPRLAGSSSGDWPQASTETSALCRPAALIACTSRLTVVLRASSCEGPRNGLSSSPGGAP